MKTLQNKRSTSLSLIAAFLLFFSSEKYASSIFSFFPASVPLQDTTISLIDSIRQYHTFDFFVFCKDNNVSSSDKHPESAQAYTQLATLCQFDNSMTRLVVQYRSVLHYNSFAQFRLDIKRSNLPPVPACS
jgi:hypothetical protein